MNDTNWFRLVLGLGCITLGSYIGLNFINRQKQGPPALPAIQQALEQQAHIREVEKLLREHHLTPTGYVGLQEEIDFLKRLEKDSFLQKCIDNAYHNDITVFAASFHEISSGVIWLDIKSSNAEIVHFLMEGYSG